jgi:hypothetical protein
MLFTFSVFVMMDAFVLLGILGILERTRGKIVGSGEWV